MISRATRNKHKREVESLKAAKNEAVAQKNQIQKEASHLISQLEEINLVVSTLYRAVTGITTGNKKDFEYGYSGRSTEVIETTTVGKLQAILVKHIEQKVEYAREDEGTALMQEHLDNLIRIIRVLSHDQTLDKETTAKIKEAEKIVDHNLQKAKERGSDMIQVPSF